MEPYYEDRGVTLYCADNREVIEMLRAAGTRVDHIITDPPYSQRAHKGARSLKGGEGPQAAVPFAASNAEVSGVLEAGLELGAFWAVLTVDYMMAFHWETEPPLGYRQIRIGVWDKLGTGAPQFDGRQPAMGFEMVSHLAPEGRPLRWQGGGQDAMYRAGLPRGRRRRTTHPTEKPIELFSTWVGRFSQRGDVLLDPWAGSGVLGRACRGLGRRAILIERDEAYCEEAVRTFTQLELISS